jgi:hypothetical protein
MPLSFDMDDQLAQRLADEIDTQGFAKLSGAVGDTELAQLRDWTDAQAQQHHGEYFAYHGEQMLAGSLFATFWADPRLKHLLADLYRRAAGRVAFKATTASANPTAFTMTPAWSPR